MFRFVQTMPAICGILILVVLGGQHQAAAVTYPDPARTFTNYPLSFNAGKTVKAPTIVLSGAQNEDWLGIFILNNADLDSLKVTITSPNQAWMAIQVYQLRPAPANLDNIFLADGMVPLGDKSLSLPGNPVRLAIGLKINQEHPPGSYKYTLTFTNGNSIVTQPLMVNVWPFALPDDLPITVMGNALYDSDWFQRYGVSASNFYNKVYPAYLYMMRQYKINSLSLNHPLPANEVASGAAAIESYPDFTGMLKTIANFGFRYFRLPNLTGEYDGTKVNQPDNLFAFKGPVYYQAWHKYLLARGWGNRALVKVWDEPPADQYPAVLDTYNIVKASVPQFATLCAGGSPDPSLAHALNIWTVYSRNYNAQADAQARSQGQQAWLYANRLHGAKRWGTNQRIIGWHLFRYNFSGYLLWAVNMFDRDPWTEQPNIDSGNRAGTWIYPHPVTGLPLPTLRLEALRRGFEDYQYFVLLQQAYQNGRVSAAAYNGIMQKIGNATSGLTVDSVPAYWKDLEEVRQDVGNLLMSAHSPKRSVTAAISLLLD